MSNHNATHIRARHSVSAIFFPLYWIRAAHSLRSLSRSLSTSSSSSSAASSDFFHCLFSQAFVIIYGRRLDWSEHTIDCMRFLSFASMCVSRITRVNIGTGKLGRQSDSLSPFFGHWLTLNNVWSTLKTRHRFACPERTRLALVK